MSATLPTPVVHACLLSVCSLVSRSSCCTVHPIAVQHARTRAALSSEAAAYRRMADSLRGQLAAAEEACRRAGEREESAQVRRQENPSGRPGRNLVAGACA